MKRKKRICLVAILLFLCCFFLNSFHFPSYAATAATITLTSNKGIVEKGEIMEITLRIQENKTAAFTANLYFDTNKVEFLSGPENNHVIQNRIIYVWYDVTGGKSAKEGELATFQFKAKKEGIANFIVEGEFYSPIGQQIEPNFKETAVQIGREETKLEKQVGEEQGIEKQKDNASLQALRINQEGLNPNFDPNIYQYYLTVPSQIEQIEMIPITENPKASAEVIGNTSLKEGLNRFEIHVTSEDKTKTNQYILEVTKTKDLQLANTNLETLAIENALLSPPFDNTVLQYTTEVSNTTTNLNLLAIPEKEEASVVISGKEEIKEGNNLIKILVTAANGFTKKEYQINVYKRNAQEEKEYEQKQKENKEKLEQAYQIEQTAKKEDPIQKEKDSTGNTMLGILILLFAIGVSCFIYILYQNGIFQKIKEKTNKKDNKK